jgi:hypothetical protein
MSIHYKEKTFAGASPAIPRNRKYETPKAKSQPRDICTQVRDTLHSQESKEIWKDHGTPTVWCFQNREAFEITTPKKGLCQIVIRPWVRDEIGKCGLINRLSGTWHIRNANDVRLIKPFIRMAKNQSEGNWLRDVQLIKDRLTGSEMKRLQQIFVHGIYANEDRICSSTSGNRTNGGRHDK